MHHILRFDHDKKIKVGHERVEQKCVFGKLKLMTNDEDEIMNCSLRFRTQLLSIQLTW